MRRFHVWLAVGGLVALAGAPVALSAQGFSVNEHSTCAMGRAGTGVAAPATTARPCSSTRPAWPACPSGRTQISPAGSLIAPNGGFTQDATGLKSDLNNKVFPVPSLYLTHGFSDQFAAGLGVFAPYGLTTDWPTDAHRAVQLLQECHPQHLRPADGRGQTRQVRAGRRRLRHQLRCIWSSTSAWICRSSDTTCPRRDLRQSGHPRRNRLRRRQDHRQQDRGRIPRRR